MRDSLDLDTATSDLLGDAARRGIDYLRTVRDRRVFPNTAELAALERLGGALPIHGEDPKQVLRLLDEVGSPATNATAGGRYFGFVVGGALPVTVASQWLAAAWDQNCCFYALSPVGVHVEDIALSWLKDLFGLPSDCGAAFVTGGQMANFTCLAAARHAVLRRVGWDVEADGLFGAPPITVIVGEESHATISKSLAMLGLGRNRVVKVPTDDQGRLVAAALPDIQGPAIVCAQAGNVNTGSFDPLDAICEWARPRGAWVHVDGAFGLWAAAAPERRYLLAGHADADSWSCDAHKWLNVPYDCGVSFVRRAEDLHRAMSLSAAYLKIGERREPTQWGPESSKRARGVEVWAALRSLGRSGVAELVERTCRHAAAFAAALRQAGHEVPNDVVLNQVLVRFGSPDAAQDDRTRAVMRAIQDEGVCWCGGTVWKGRAAMRISVSNWSTTEADVAASLDSILRAARAVDL